MEKERFGTDFLSGWHFKTLLLTILLSVIGYILFTLWAGWANVGRAIAQVGFWGIILCLFLSLINFGLRFLRWQLFLSILGHQIHWLPSLRIYLSGFALTTTPGKTGEALRGVFLKGHGVPFRKSIAAFFAERFCDLMAVSLLAVGGIWNYPPAQPVLLIAGALISFCIYAASKESWVRAIERVAKKKLPLSFSQTIEFFAELLGAFRSCFSLDVFLGVLALSALAWMAEAVSLYYLVHAMGYEIPLISALFIYGFSLVIGGITLLPGGLGSAEATMLQLLLLNNIGTSEAAALTLVVRLTTLWFSVLLGLIALPKKQMLA